MAKLRQAPPRLNRQMRMATGILLGSWLLSLCLCWRHLRLHPTALLGALTGLLAALYFIDQLKRHLGTNYRRGEENHMLETLGAANWITLLRAGATVGLAGFLCLAIQADPTLPVMLNWAPGCIYLAIAAADIFDGYIARRHRRETELGKRLDIEADAAGLLVAALVAVALGRLPVIYLLAGLAYYLFIFGIWMRQKRSLAVIALQQRPYARIIAGFQMGLVAMALLPVFHPGFTIVAARIFMIPLLIGFLRDWLVVSGRVKTDGAQRSLLDHWTRTWVGTAVPLVLRLVILGGGIATLVSSGIFQTHPLWQMAHSFCCLLAGVGCMGRFASLSLLLMLASTLSPFGINPLSMIIFAAAAALVLLGTGAISLWTPEEPILYRRPKKGPIAHCETS